MNPTAQAIVECLAWTTLALSLAACFGWLLLRILRVSSPRANRMVWFAVLMQGWLFWKVVLPILPGESAAAVSPSTTSESPTGVFAFDPPATQHDLISDNAVERPEFVADFSDDQVQTTALTASIGNVVEPFAFRALWPAILVVVWLSGIVIILARFVTRYVRFCHGLRFAPSAPAEWQSRWQEMLAEAGVTRDIPMLLHDSGPLLCRAPRGYRLLVPADLWLQLTDVARESILLHEIAHVQRADVWKSLFIRLLALPHWFNPFAWLAARNFDRNAELACDDIVRRRHASHVPEYARTLLNLAVGENSPTALSPAAGGPCLAERIRRLITPNRKEDSLMKRMSLFAVVTGLSLIGFIRIGVADSENVAKQQSDESQSPAPPTASKDLTGQPQAAESIAASGEPVSKASARKYKIDEAVIDLAHIFKNLPSFKRQRDEMQKQVKAADAKMREQARRLQAAQRQAKPDPFGSKQFNRQKADFEKMRNDARRKFMAMEARIYAATYERIQAEVAKYAKEKDIRVVRRRKPLFKNKQNPADSRAVLQKINQDVVYQADERVDITQEILKRLKAAEERSAKPKAAN